MIKQATALALARRHCSDGCQVDEAKITEFASGWYFGYRMPEDPTEQLVGSNGLIVDKMTGDILVLGSAFSVHRDIEMHERGYRFSLYDLVILAFSDLERAIDALIALQLSRVQPTYDGGTVWRIPLPYTRTELASCLAKLPHVFGAVTLYFVLEQLEEARREKLIEFDVLKCPKGAVV